MAETSIEWTSGPNGEPGYTFNPVEGCQRVSPGCVNCYAERKNKWLHGGENWGPGSPRLLRSEAYWKKPLRWDAEALKAGERRKVFCASVADVFEDHPGWVVPRFRLFSLIRRTPNLDWLLLTKRPENIMRLWPNGEPADPLATHGDARAAQPPVPPPGPEDWPNLWLGTTVEDQERAVRLSELLAVPAVLHFVSAEPLLSVIDLFPWLNPVPGMPSSWPSVRWVICGGESGPGARPFDVEWARSLRDQCAAAGVAFFMKQLGARTRMALDGGDPLPMFFKKHQSTNLGFMPEDLRVRQFPEVRHA